MCPGPIRTSDDVAALAREVGLGDLAEEIAALALPAFRLEGFAGALPVGESGLLRFSVPAGPVDEGGLARVVVESPSDNEGVEVGFRPQLTVPSIGVGVPAALERLGFGYGGRNYDRESSYLELADRLMGAGVSPQYLGWPRTIQNDVLDECRSFGEERGTHEERWRLLLQVPDPESGGGLYYCIPDADLEAGRFDRVEATLQTD